MKLENDWKRIWNNREKYSFDIPREIADSPRDLFMYMKKLNGFDTGGGDIAEDALFVQLDQIEEKLNKRRKCGSVFEVGCGSGANLLMFSQKGMDVGGIDYSRQLIDFAEKYLDKSRVKELVCDNALNMGTDVKYDAGLSNSVFSYFTDYDYAQQVLEKLLDKCRYSIVLIDIHDLDKKDDFIAFRKKAVENYDELYKDLPKLFYPKSFFEDFAAKHGLALEFYNSEVNGYWNNEFVFNVCLYR